MNTGILANLVSLCAGGGGYLMLEVKLGNELLSW